MAKAGDADQGLADEALVREALVEAAAAERLGEVPVGAIVVSAEHGVVGRGHNLRERDRDPLAHAELIAIREASVRLGRWRLLGCTLVVTLEPCVMCAGALVNARLDRLVYGAPDPKAGAVASLYQVPTDARLNHRLEVRGGVLAAECGAVLSRFFAGRRARGGAP